MRRWALALVAGAGLLGLAPAASANGRFPAANQLVVHPSDPATLLLRTTFGLLLSSDRGQSSSFVCDRIIGSSSVVDPGVAITADGSIVVASPEGLGVSRDHGCGFELARGALALQRFIDVSVDKGTPAHAVAITATQLSSGGEHAQLFETRDNGVTWLEVGAPLDPTVLVTTLDIAPSRSHRLYVSGTHVAGGKIEGYAARSDDGGLSWTASTSSFPKDAALYIGAVDPLDADRVYLRTFVNEKGPSELLVSTDGASTFTSVLTTSTPLTGLALSPDGNRIAVGSNAGTQVASRDRDDAGVGVGSMVFERTSADPSACLTWTKDALYTCGSGVSADPACVRTLPPQYLLARSNDEGRSWQPLIADLGAVEGPDPTCSADTPSAKVCASDWARQHALLACPTADAGAPSSDAGADAGSSSLIAPSDGCGCSAVPTRVPMTGAAGLAIGAAVFVQRRRRSTVKRR